MACRYRRHQHARMEILSHQAGALFAYNIAFRTCQIWRRYSLVFEEGILIFTLETISINLHFQILTLRNPTSKVRFARIVDTVICARVDSVFVICRRPTRFSLGTTLELFHAGTRGTDCLSTAVLCVCRTGNLFEHSHTPIHRPGQRLARETRF